MRKIVEAFVQVSRHELKHGKLVLNEGAWNPRQAFRVEIVDNFDLHDEAHSVYQGLVRWHLFLQDWPWEERARDDHAATLPERVSCCPTRTLRLQS